MDGETERKIAALILAEAQRLKARAAEEGVRAYLKPNVRYKPNSQFLRATVQSVEYANRVADVNEMWKQREEELEEDRGEPRGEVAERPLASRDARKRSSSREGRREGHREEKTVRGDDEARGWRRGEDEERAWRREGGEEQAARRRGRDEEEERAWRTGDDNDRAWRKGETEERCSHRGLGEVRGWRRERKQEDRNQHRGGKHEERVVRRRVSPNLRGEEGGSWRSGDSGELEAQADKRRDVSDKQLVSVRRSGDVWEEGRLGSEERARRVGGRSSKAEGVHEEIRAKLLWKGAADVAQSDKGESRERRGVHNNKESRCGARIDADGEMCSDEDHWRGDRSEACGEEENADLGKLEAFEADLGEERRLKDRKEHSGGHKDVEESRGHARNRRGYARARVQTRQGTWEEIDDAGHSRRGEALGKRVREDDNERISGRGVEKGCEGRERRQRPEGALGFGSGGGVVDNREYMQVGGDEEHRSRGRRDGGDGLGMDSWSNEDAEQKGIDDSDLIAFLKAKAKRGRGAIGSRADAWGSEPPSLPIGTQGGAEAGGAAVSMLLARVREEWEDSVVAGKGGGFSASWASAVPSAAGAAKADAAGVGAGVGGGSAGGAGGRWIRGAALDTGKWTHGIADGSSGSGGSSGSSGSSDRSSSSSSSDGGSGTGDTGTSSSSESSERSREKRKRRRDRKRRKWSRSSSKHREKGEMHKRRKGERSRKEKKRHHHKKEKRRTHRKDKD